MNSEELLELKQKIESQLCKIRQSLPIVNSKTPEEINFSAEINMLKERKSFKMQEKNEDYLSVPIHQNLREVE